MSKCEINPAVVQEGIEPLTVEQLEAKEQESVDELYCQHVMHVVDDLPKFMDAAWRALKKGSTMVVTVPHMSSNAAAQDIMTKRLISETTFLNFNKEWREKNIPESRRPKMECDFDINFSQAFDPEYDLRSDVFKGFGARHYRNFVTEIRAVLTKK